MIPHRRALQYEQIIRQGFELLEQRKAYTQASIRRKLESLGKGISAASMSNILNGNRKGKEVLRRGGEGILEIVRSELGYDFDEAQMSFNTDRVAEGWKPYIIPEKEEAPVEADTGQPIFHPEGRWPINQKVAFLSSAQDEVVEVGIRLRTFANYFTSRNEHEFKLPIYGLLERGVHFKAYLLDPECQEARLYFHDRARVLEEELGSIEKIRSVLRQLSRIIEEIENQQFPGKFQVLLYKHVPYNHFLIVDGERGHGKMAVSPYLYGINRANCPVVELTKQSNRDLFRRYYQSFQFLSQDARLWQG